MRGGGGGGGEEDGELTHRPSKDSAGHLIGIKRKCFRYVVR